MFTLKRFPVLDSTSDEARRILLSAAADISVLHGSAIIAERQENGRGRVGREWHSPSGNLYASFILLPDAPAETLQQLVFVAAVAVSGIIPESQLKWPNDILLQGKKVGGILLEAIHRADNAPAAILGVGINVASFPEKVDHPATSLRHENVGMTLPELEERLVNALAAEYEAWQRNGFAPVREKWLARGPQLGAPVTVRMEGEKLEGFFDGIDEKGVLRLKTGDGARQEISVGEVTHATSD